MLLAAVGDTSYNIFVFLHIVLMIVGLAPAIVDPVVAARWQSDRPALQKFAGTMASANQKLFATALIIGGLLGFGIAGLSDQVYSVGDGWLLASVIGWIVMIGLLHGALIPAGRALAEGDESAVKRLQMFGPALNVVALIVLFLMVFKPGA